MSATDKSKVVNKEHNLSNIEQNVFVIPSHMKEGIRQGKEDIKNGNVYTMTEFEQKYRDFLK